MAEYLEKVDSADLFFVGPIIDEEGDNDESNKEAVDSIVGDESEGKYEDCVNKTRVTAFIKLLKKLFF